MSVILVVDDDPNVRDVIARYFSQLKYEVVVAKDGMEALEIVKQTPINLAIVDVMMPYLDGYALTQEIRARYNVPILLLTAKGQIEDKEKGYVAGTDDYVVKPFDPKELQLRVDALLRRYGTVSLKQDLVLGELMILPEKYEIKINWRTLLLPLKEFELLVYMVKIRTKYFRENKSSKRCGEWTTRGMSAQSTFI